MTENLNKYKDQSNKAIDNESTFDNSSFILSSGTSDLLPVVTVYLRGEKKNREAVVSGLTCLWDSEATDSMIKRRHNKHYERRMRSNRVEYSTAASVYCTTHDVKVPFCIPEFSSSKIINHRFHVDNYEVESGIGYDVIIGRELMVQSMVWRYCTYEGIQKFTRAIQSY